MCTRSGDSQDKVTQKKVFLKEEMLELYLRGRVHQAVNGWKSNKTEGETQDMEYAGQWGWGRE